MFKKSLLAIVTATALFGFNASSFAAGFFDAWLCPPSGLSACMAVSPELQ